MGRTGFVESSSTCDVGRVIARASPIPSINTTTEGAPGRILRCSARSAQTHPATPSQDKGKRWDHSSVHDFEGTYGNYVLAKVSKQFPELSD